VTCPPARARALGETSDSGAACPFGFDGKFKEESTSRDDRDGGRDMKGISSVAGPFSLLLAVSLTNQFRPSSAIASNWIGRFGTSLVKMPSLIASISWSDASAAMLSEAAAQLKRVPTSIDTLSPNDPFVRAIKSRGRPNTVVHPNSGCSHFAHLSLEPVATQALQVKKSRVALVSQNCNRSSTTKLSA
jgi:hypothetical protein